MITVTMHVSGPLFDGRADLAAKAFTNDLRHELATGGRNILVALMQQSFKAPRPYYWTTIKVDRIGPDTESVTDRGSVVYNFWLAGKGSRNFPVTRFGGYKMWPRAVQITNARFDPLARQMLPRYLERMN